MSKPQESEKTAEEPKKRPYKSCKGVDLESLERDYRTGRFTLQELETKYGIAKSEISRKAKSKGWKKDLADAVRQATSAALIADAVQEGVNGVQDTVLAAAELNKQVILEHRKRAARAAKVTMALMDELEEAAQLLEHREILAQIMASGMDGEADPAALARAHQAIQRALSIGQRSSSVKALTEAIAKQIDIERKAFGLDDDAPPDAEKQSLEVRFVTPEPGAADGD